MMNRIFLNYPVALALFSIAWSALGANWPQWRGPEFNGSTTEKNLPIAWSQTNGIKWSASLPAYAASTPIVWGNSVFLTSPDAGKDLLLVHVDARTGREVWRKTVASQDREQGRNNMSSPSPVTDGKVVIAMFATGNLCAYDFSGKQIWSRDLAKDYGAFANMWIYGASPLLLGGRLYIPVMQRNPVPPDYRHAQSGGAARESFLLCVDSATGTDLWRHLRVTAAKDESMEAYTTPIPRRVDGRTEILLFGANNLTAHDSLTGAELWRSPDLNTKQVAFWRVVPSPAAVDDLVIVCAPKGEPVFAIRPRGKGQLGADSIAWSWKQQPSDCCTPLAYEGRLFVLNGDRQVLTRIDPRTGRVVWQGSLGAHEIFRASPLGADGKIYCVSESGTVVVLDAGDEFKILATIPMGEAPVRSSMVAADGCLYIRTAKHLYCVGNK